MYALKDRSRIRRYIFKSFGIVGLFAFVSVLIYFFFGPQLIQLLYGKEYIVSRMDTTLIAVCVGFFLFSLLLFRIHLSRGTPEYPSYSLLVSLLVLILMIYGLNLQPLLLVEIALLSSSFILTILQLLPILLPRFFSKKG
jgi:O-antigen/teichoic acid export membrane protein